MSEPEQTNLEKGVMYCRKHDFRAANPMLAEAVREEPENAMAWYYFGYTHWRMYEYDRALPAFERAAELDPQHKDYLFMLADTCSKVGNYERGLEVAKQMKALGPYRLNPDPIILLCERKLSS